MLKRDKRVQTIYYEFWEQDHLDLLSYSGLEEQTSYLVIDGQYIRVLFISGYPYIASSGWLNSLVNFNHNADISYHITTVESTQALPKLHRKITELESTKRAMIRNGKIVGPEVTDPLESAMALRDKILRGQEKLFQVSIYVSLFADSLADLDKITQLLETVLASRMFYSKVARYQQLEGLQSICHAGKIN